MMAKKRLKMTDSREIRRAINRISNMLLNDELDPKVGNAILYACNISLSAVRVDDQQRKLEELERLVKEIENGH
ncbi:MAG: hypothetical protein HFF73_05465 [Oscillospiraceae bacterium]|nr:hypothetical protein [Oscillospiraceae bacterium]